ncbi:fer-1 5 [Pelobates cultripes]|nr:fer-1 5 [Pelobates cultripes]
MNTLTLKVICTWKEKTGKVNIHEGLRIEQDQWKKDFSDNVQDFQVRVRIIAGRQLYGNNIKPVVKVLVGKKSHHTSVRRGNNPYFNEAIDILQRIDRAFERFWQQLEVKTLPSQPTLHRRQCIDGDLGNPDLLVGKSTQNKPENNPQERRATTAAAAMPRLQQRKLGTRIKRKATRAPRGTWTKMTPTSYLALTHRTQRQIPKQAEKRIDGALRHIPHATRCRDSPAIPNRGRDCRCYTPLQPSGHVTDPEYVQPQMGIG